MTMTYWIGMALFGAGSGAVGAVIGNVGGYRRGLAEATRVFERTMAEVTIEVQSNNSRPND